MDGIEGIILESASEARALGFSSCVDTIDESEQTDKGALVLW
jgi:hypothetical protein